MKKYLVTGYSKKDGRMATHIYDAIEHVAELINQCANKEIIKSSHDLDFDVQTRRNHNGAEIVYADDYTWSIFLLQK